MKNAWPYILLGLLIAWIVIKYILGGKTDGLLIKEIDKAIKTNSKNIKRREKEIAKRKYIDKKDININNVDAARSTRQRLRDELLGIFKRNK